MKKNIFGKQLSIGIVVLVVLGSVLTVNAYDNKIAVSSLGDTLYVGGSGPGNYSTIWEAVINTSNGDTVFVYDYSSPYYEHVTIYNQINLIGENKETTIIDGNGTGNVLSVAADWVTISGFTIQNGVNGIYLDKQSNTTISGNIVKDHAVDGILFYSSCDYNTVTGNIVSNNGETGIKFSSFSEYNIISENLISNNLNGTSLAAYAYGEITGNSFEDNTGYALILNLWCNENKIHFNNFIGNVNDAKFTTSVMNRWSFNYWDRPHILPKPIFGRIAVFPWVNFDWRPLLTPHELP
ncbi:MAG: right-handed parallel beta-helix repeat-containing protein [Thermoplasmatales archaeon]|nr:right-handed parallel beta-helix repeat-containing protein [Thermoplasmatales archaeon]